MDNYKFSTEQSYPVSESFEKNLELQKRFEDYISFNNPNLLTPTELHALFDFLLIKKTKSDYVSQRRVVALSFLYITNLDTSAIIDLTKESLKLFIEGEEINIEVRKKMNFEKKKFYRASILDLGKKFLTPYRACFDFLLHRDVEGPYVFSREKEATKTLSLEVFNRDLSQILREASKPIQKKLRLSSLKSMHNFADVKEVRENVKNQII